MKYLLQLFLGILLFGLVMQGCGASPSATTIQVSATEDVVVEFVLPTQICGDYFIVDTLIDGCGPYPMLLDTGAGTTVLSPEIAKELGISKRIDSLEIDRFKVTGSLRCKVRKVAHIGRALGIPIDGILSFNVFEGVLLTYDFPKQEIRVRQGAFNENELTRPGVMPTSAGDRPFVTATTDKGVFRVLLDTGSSRSLTFTKMNYFSFMEPPQSTGARMRINGLFLVKTGRLNGDMKIGPLTLHRPLIHNSVSINLIGQEILRDFVVTFDQNNHVVHFARPGGKLSDALEFEPFYGTGIAVAPRDDRLIVRKVFDGTPADAAGLQVDDEILAIDGTKIADRGCAHLEHKEITGPEPTDMLIERNGKSMHIEFMTGILVK